MSDEAKQGHEHIELWGPWGNPFTVFRVDRTLSLGIEIGGSVVIKPVKEWHALALSSERAAIVQVLPLAPQPATITTTTNDASADTSLKREDAVSGGSLPRSGSVEAPLSSDKRDKARRRWHRDCGTRGLPCPTKAMCEAFDIGYAAAEADQSAMAPTMPTHEHQLRELCEYIDGFFISGNDVPVERSWMGADSWTIAKECIEHGIPLSHDLIEREGVYRRKRAVYGDETRATSPLQEVLNSRQYVSQSTPK